ncbi:ATP-dependent DNA helicase RecG [Candidatus Margulisiibacteriota bacterium]
MKLDTPAQYVKGVGPKVAKLFKKLGVETVEDLIYFFPRDYEDRSQVTRIADLQPTNYAVIKGEITRIDHQMTRNRFSVMKLEVYDRTAAIQAVWFNQPYLARMFRKGMKLIISGKVEISEFDGVMQVSVRDYEIDTGQNLKIVPRYDLTQGLYPKKVKSIVETALENCLKDIEDWLPAEIRRKYKLRTLLKSISTLHFPEDLSKVEPARRRLAFDEFFLFQLGLGLRKKTLKSKTGISFNIDHEMIGGFKKTLPFTLTTAQERVLGDILSDMQNAQPMNRLLQGDVGSGKTIVAAIAALAAIKNGYQVAIMAPTEILAQQHHGKLVGMLEEHGAKVKLMTSTTRKQKTENQEQKTDIFVGTHALIQSGVEYEKLGLVIIDEQHRFGVLQRASLAKKGITPDVLVMTATPIPRSLSLTLYGELDRSVIDEMPPGRTPIKTHYIPEKKRKDSYKFMRERIEEGRQVFIVCPLVEESEKVDLKAAMDEAERLQNDVFPEYKIGLMHGRLKGAEKDKIMKDFKAGKIHILVSTTVIEVGIDIPNATVMIIEHAERFGLAQLHQLRGRIGRGSEQSYCFLIANTKTPDAKERIKAMIDSTDGFHIAEVDLKLRGPGDFFGTRQSGLPEFRVADIIRDEKILRVAREAAGKLIQDNIEQARAVWHSQSQKIARS